ETVRGAGIVNFLRTFDEARRFPRGVVHRDDLVVFAVQNERRHVDLPEILRKVCLRKGLDALVGVLDPTLHAPEPELIENTLRDFRSWPVGAVELEGQILVELGAVLEDACADRIEDLHRQAFWIGGSLQHEGRYGRDQDGLRYPLCAVPADVSRHLPAPP